MVRNLHLILTWRHSRQLAAVPLEERLLEALGSFSKKQEPPALKEVRLCAPAPVPCDLECIQVDMERLMKEAGLDKLFEVEDWPSPNAVRKLYTRFELAKKQAGVELYLSPDLRECAACLRERCLG